MRMSFGFFKTLGSLIFFPIVFFSESFFRFFRHLGTNLSRNKQMKGHQREKFMCLQMKQS